MLKSSWGQLQSRAHIYDHYSPQTLRRNADLSARVSSSPLQAVMPIQCPTKLAERLLSDWKLILGSASRSRRAIFDTLTEELGCSYEVCTADIDERAIGDRSKDDPKELVLRLAEAKAAAIREKLGSDKRKALLITCDQVVSHQGTILEKPVNEQEAWDFIRSYADGPALTIGSVMCTNLWTDKVAKTLDIAEVHIRPIPDDIIQAMVTEGFVFHCAGALMVEHPMVAPYIERIEGTVDGVMGIDKSVAVRMMAEASDL